MNQTFSFPRFARLNRWLWATKGRTYLIGALSLLPISALVTSQILNTEYYVWSYQRDHMAYFSFLALFLTFSIGSDVFSMLFKQESAIAYLMIPASRFEKFWLGVLYCVIAIFLLGLVYFGYQAFIITIANSHLPASESERYVPSVIYYASPAPNDREILAITLYAITISLAVSILGSFYFRRGVLVRNLGIALLATLGLLFLYVWIVSSQSGGHSVGTALPFFPIAIHTTKEHFDMLGPPTWLQYVAYAGTLLALWVTARIRFNEVER